MLIDVGNPILKVGGTIPWLGVLNCMGVQKASRAVGRHAFIFLMLRIADVISCFKFLS